MAAQVLAAPVAVSSPSSFPPDALTPMEAAGPDGQPPDVAMVADGLNAVAHVLAAPVAEGMAAPIA